jgi:hypothetical protein
MATEQVFDWIKNELTLSKVSALPIANQLL